MSDEQSKPLTSDDEEKGQALKPLGVKASQEKEYELAREVAVRAVARQGFTEKIQTKVRKDLGG